MLDALARYDILDTPADESFDRVTRLVRHIFKASMATVTFLDGHRQWFKSRQGVAHCEGERRSALCDVAIRRNEPLIVRDTLADPRFAANPLVVGAPYLRFYAGVPLRSRDGQNIGTLCAMDTTPRDMDADEIAILSDLAGIVMDALEVRRAALTKDNERASSQRQDASASASGRPHRVQRRPLGDRLHRAAAVGRGSEHRGDQHR